MEVRWKENLDGFADKGKARNRVCGKLINHEFKLSYLRTDKLNLIDQDIRDIGHDFHSS